MTTVMTKVVTSSLSKALSALCTSLRLHTSQAQNSQGIPDTIGQVCMCDHLSSILVAPSPIEMSASTYNATQSVGWLTSSRSAAMSPAPTHETKSILDIVYIQHNFC
eukprot:TRINITY_DN12041_c0_g1_i1.p3 TRINITY_DN12041_c0_g1~~TRINITY_DN12041_c0_g1_i1.p3  ORF type:complete len:107 (+),score=0.99 TRINITY_DN12041_c0_g1_i1:1101-1421(+)